VIEKLSSLATSGASVVVVVAGGWVVAVVVVVPVGPGGVDLVPPTAGVVGFLADGVAPVEPAPDEGAPAPGVWAGAEVVDGGNVVVVVVVATVVVVDVADRPVEVDSRTAILESTATELDL
jgi:hypothetical protein